MNSSGSVWKDSLRSPTSLRNSGWFTDCSSFSMALIGLTPSCEVKDCSRVWVEGEVVAGSVSSWGPDTRLGSMMLGLVREMRLGQELARPLPV